MVKSIRGPLDEMEVLAIAFTTKAGENACFLLPDSLVESLRDKIEQYRDRNAGEEWKDAQ